MAKVIPGQQPEPRPEPDPPRINEGGLERGAAGRKQLAQEIVTRVADLEDRQQQIISAVQTRVAALETWRQQALQVILDLIDRVEHLEAQLPQQPEPDPPTGEA